jgi:hypothetical protein
MFKKIENWLEAKQDAVQQEQYDNGFGYAATQILKYGINPETLDGPTVFELGINDAKFAISDLQRQVKKLDRIEAENKDLREIVQLMQKELGRLLVQLDGVSKPQALSNAPASEPKLPFKLDELPEWANWVAQDENGLWYAYEKKPYQQDLQWLEESKDGDVESICRTEVIGDWRDTLYEIPKR